MPVFQYKGFDSKGKAVHGVKDADNLRALRANLKRDGILITEESMKALAEGVKARGRARLATK